MKPLVNARRGLFVLMLTAVCVYPVESARILNEPDGFNGYRWGTTIDRYPELRPVLDEAIANQPIARLGQASEMTAAILWLCSPGASFVVGVALPVDGGYTAR